MDDAREETHDVIPESRLFHQAADDPPGVEPEALARRAADAGVRVGSRPLLLLGELNIVFAGIKGHDDLFGIVPFRTEHRTGGVQGSRRGSRQTWRFDPKKGPGNSGVLLRVAKKDEVWPKSMEAQLNSGDAGDIWNIGDFPAKTDAARTEGRRTKKMGKCSEDPIGGWNSYRIVMDGGKLELYVNGQLQNVATDVERVPGRIALQSEGAWIEFRMVRIRPLKGNGTGLGYE